MTTSRSLPAERSDLVRALGAFVERPTAAHAGLADALGFGLPTAADHTDLFVQQLPPYASIYLGLEGGIGGAARDAIAGFWRAVGLTPPSEPDHLAALFGLWAALGEAPRDDAEAPLTDHAISALVWEHLASWLVPYLARVREVGPPSYTDWAATVGDLLATTPVGAAGDDLPTHLSVPAAPPEGPDDVVTFVLAPIRSGLVLTRTDIARAASDLGLGMRIGERAYALSAMVDQDAPAVVAWLGTEAERQAAVVAESPGPGPIADWWAARLEGAVTILTRGYGDRP